MAKMVRVFYVFNNPTLQKKYVCTQRPNVHHSTNIEYNSRGWYISHISEQLLSSGVNLGNLNCFSSDPHQTLKDIHLALFVCALVTVDVVILFVYTLVEV